MPDASTRRGRPAAQVRGHRRGFGEVEKLPSGRFRARWTDSSGGRVTAPQTFASVADARVHLSTVQADILRRTYRAPRRLRETLVVYGERWIDLRPGLKDSTRHQYGIDFRRHIVPTLGSAVVEELEPATIRDWHAVLSRDLRIQLAGTATSAAGRRDGRATVARAYRLLRSILQTAVDDEILLRNPCRIAGAGDPRSAERPTLTMTEIAALADAVPPPYRAFVLMAGFSGLRAGELAALRLRDVRRDAGELEVTVVRRLYRVGGTMTVEEPKSHAGHRTVPLPPFLAVELDRHLSEHRDGADRNDLIFVTRPGRDVMDTYSQVLRRGLDRIGREDCRAHDLRHSALTAAAEHGATLATLMQMAGHSTPAAAQRYQHATTEHARRVAAAIDASAAARFGVAGHR